MKSWLAPALFVLPEPAAKLAPPSVGVVVEDGVLREVEVIEALLGRPAMLGVLPRKTSAATSGASAPIAERLWASNDQSAGQGTVAQSGTGSTDQAWLSGAAKFAGTLKPLLPKSTIETATCPVAKRFMC